MTLLQRSRKHWGGEEHRGTGQTSDWSKGVLGKVGNSPPGEAAQHPAEARSSWHLGARPLGRRRRPLGSRPRSTRRSCRMPLRLVRPWGGTRRGRAAIPCQGLGDQGFGVRLSGLQYLSTRRSCRMPLRLVRPGGGTRIGIAAPPCETGSTQKIVRDAEFRKPEARGGHPNRESSSSLQRIGGFHTVDPKSETQNPKK